MLHPRSTGGDRRWAGFQVAYRPEGGWARLFAWLRPQYQEVRAVQGIDLAVESGTALAFIGPNGAGKSTTIKMHTGSLVGVAGDGPVANIPAGPGAEALWFGRIAR